ncbi:MFS transporter [Desulfitobacterium sp. PCE1]|uniref:MFS transporter n=1 Tax=Desulfitobacterium sp. PCE1 TaxID=146907 RepID=UPI000378339F|nr:MFS transporter [Desulfitobacterium sp. PCE1]
MIVGKLLAGAIIDRFGIIATNWYLFIMWGLALASAFLVDGSQAKAYLLTILIGLGNPILTIPIPLWVVELFGLRDYVKIFSILTLMIFLGGAIGNSLVGFMADVTGTYLTAYGVFAVANVLLIMLLQIIFKKKRLHTNLKISNT